MSEHIENITLCGSQAVTRESISRGATLETVTEVITLDAVERDAGPELDDYLPAPRCDYPHNIQAFWDWVYS